MKPKFGEFYLSDFLKSPLGILAGVLFGVFYAFIIVKKGILGAGLFPPLLFMGFYMVAFFRDPTLGLLSVVFLAFVGIGLIRYVPGVPLGLSIDGVLFLTFLAMLFQINNKPRWDLIMNPLFYVSVIWMGYAVLELANPQARSRVAWFYAMRGVHLYMLMTVPLSFCHME